MTEILESVKPPEEEFKEPPPPEKEPVTIRAILLFDGTMNNKTNIQSREEKDKFYQKTRSKKFLLFGELSEDGATSYENGRTNVVTLDTNTMDLDAQGYMVTVQGYTEGAGTKNNEGDSTRGYGFGIGPAGVKAKCKGGISKIMEAIQNKKVNGKDLSPEEHFIKLLTIDVFGFSRGAATARYAVHQLLFAEDSIEQLLKRQGFSVEKVEVGFVGIFDTVSSHGLNFKNDTEALHLNAIADKGKVKGVLHLAAADEHRKNFSLTNVKQSGREEYYVPGAHSDVGGSYHDYDPTDKYYKKGNGEEHFYLNSGSIAESNKICRI